MMKGLGSGPGVFVPFLVFPLGLVRADEIDHRPGEQDGAADPVEHEVFLHVRVRADPAVKEEPEAKAEKADGKKIGADLGRLLFRHSFLAKGKCVVTRLMGLALRNSRIMPGVRGRMPLAAP